MQTIYLKNSTIQEKNSITDVLIFKEKMNKYKNFIILNHK